MSDKQRKCAFGPKPKRGGPKSKFEHRMIDDALEMAMNGASVSAMGKKFSVNACTIYAWMHDIPEFRDAIELGRQARTSGRIEIVRLALADEAPQ